MRHLATVAVISFVFVTAIGCGRAPTKATGWRGDGSGVYPAATPEAEWDSDEKKGILWKVKVGDGFSSPVVVGNRVFVAVEQEKLICVDATTHKVLWERNNAFEDLPKELGAEEKREATSCGFATATAVTDGRRVWASFGTGIVACYDLDGNRRWIVWLDNPQQAEYGRAASPRLVDGKLIVTAGFLVALDPATGKTLWTCEDAAESYGTPAVATVGGVTVLITPMGDVARVSDGMLLERRLASTTYTSPVVAADRAYFVDGRTKAFTMTAAEGGKIAFKKAWQIDLEGEIFASPVVHDGILYVASNDGFLDAIDAATGDVLYHQQLDIASAAAMPGMPPGNLYASLAIAGGKLFVSNDQGQTLALQPGREFKQLAKNYIEEGSAACLSFDGKFVYLRGGEDLYCVGPAHAE